MCPHILHGEESIKAQLNQYCELHFLFWVKWLAIWIVTHSELKPEVIHKESVKNLTVFPCFDNFSNKEWLCNAGAGDQRAI